MQDQETGRANKEILVSKGLELKTPEKILRIDTGRVNNIKDVVGAIASEIDDTTRILTIEGKSGTGKSSTACELKETLGCTMLSMGEVFRYLTFHSLRGESDYDVMLEKMYYEGNGKGLVLVDRGVGDDFEIGALRSHEVEGRVSAVSAENQRRVIDFMSKQMILLKQKGDHRVLIEGRAYTLDFLPSDLRVKLIADPSVRAQRRWNQEYSGLRS